VLPSNLEIVNRGETMSQKQRGLFVVAILLIGAILISSCTFSLSQAPAQTPTLIPTGLFVSPYPSGENPMDVIQQFARETAAAQTVIASGGTPGTPVPVASTIITPQTGGTPTPSNNVTPTNVVVACTPPPACPAGQTLICGSGSCPGGCGQICSPITLTFTPVTPGAAGVKPSSYTLQKGEFPYCIARRFNVNPDELLSLNGIVDGGIYMPGYTLRIPQTNNPFPAARALQPHPVTYTVSSSDETVYGVACRYGDVEPSAIAQANGISISSPLSAGQQLKIP
jgi:LysM repeat protein